MRLAGALAAAVWLLASAAAQPLALGDPDIRSATSGAAATRDYLRMSTREVGDDRVINGRNGRFTIVRRPSVQGGDGNFCTSQIVREQFVQIGLDERHVVRTMASEYVHIPMPREECERHAADFDRTSTSPSPFGQPDSELRCSHPWARVCIGALDRARQIAEQHRSSGWQNAFFTNGRGYTRWTGGAQDREQVDFDRVFGELFQRESLPIVTIETDSGRFTRIDCSRFDWPDHGALICQVGDALYVELTAPPHV
jgi:hypothetical protein